MGNSLQDKKKNISVKEPSSIELGLKNVDSIEIIFIAIEIIAYSISIYL